MKIKENILVSINNSPNGRSSRPKFVTLLEGFSKEKLNKSNEKLIIDNFKIPYYNTDMILYTEDIDNLSLNSVGYVEVLSLKNIYSYKPIIQFIKKYGFLQILKSYLLKNKSIYNKLVKTKGIKTTYIAFYDNDYVRFTYNSWFTISYDTMSAKNFEFHNSTRFVYYLKDKYGELIVDNFEVGLEVMTLLKYDNFKSVKKFVDLYGHIAIPNKVLKKNINKITNIQIVKLKNYTFLIDNNFYLKDYLINCLLDNKLNIIPEFYKN